MGTATPFQPTCQVPSVVLPTQAAALAHDVVLNTFAAKVVVAQPTVAVASAAHIGMVAKQPLLLKNGHDEDSSPGSVILPSNSCPPQS
jgi:hypothetical protein